MEDTLLGFGEAEVLEYYVDSQVNAKIIHWENVQSQQQSTLSDTCYAITRELLKPQLQR